MADSHSDWSDATIIDKDILGEYIYRADDSSDTNLHVCGHSVQIKPAGYDYEGLATYLGDRFVNYVFSKDQIEEFREDDKSAEKRAYQAAGIGSQYKQDGVLGEFLLFLLTDGFFNIPMISHKIQLKQTFNMQVFGSDNVFFGEFNGEECVGIGEAKVVNDNQTSGIRKAVDSVVNFHDGNSERYMSQEINFAPKSILSSNLSPGQVDELAEILSNEGISEYPILHPIFICYDLENLSEAESVEKTVEERKEQINTILENEEYLLKARNKVEKSHERLSRAHLLFLFLPVPNLDEFRERMLIGINPTLEEVIKLRKKIKSADGEKGGAES